MAMSKKMRGMLAHNVLIQTWMVGPVVFAGSAALVGSGHGVPGMAAGIVLLLGVMQSSQSYLIRGAICVAATALAAQSPKEKKPLAMTAAAVFNALVWVVTRHRPFSPSQSFFDFVMKTMNPRNYYDQMELRGALDEITPGKNFVCCHPHGCLTSGYSFNLFWNEEFHKRTGRIAFMIAPALRYKNPFFRLVVDWYAGENRSCGGADKKFIKQAMDRGDSLGIIPGGFEDATIAKYGKERTYLKKRKGFVKYCLESGYKLIPVWTFGEGDTFYTFQPFLKLRLWLNGFGIPGCLFFGNPWCPILPRSDARVLSYVGSPLQLPRIEKPTDAEVDEWHGKYVQALQAVFDKHKAEAGKPDAVLEIW